MVLIATNGPAMDWLAPTARNSKRLPVKASGLVRLRSPESLGNTGKVSTPTVNDLSLVARHPGNLRRDPVSSSPEKSRVKPAAPVRPKRKSLLEEAARSKPLNCVPPG